MSIQKAWSVTCRICGGRSFYQSKREADRAEAEHAKMHDTGATRG